MSINLLLIIVAFMFAKFDDHFLGNGNLLQKLHKTISNELFQTEIFSICAILRDWRLIQHVPQTLTFVKIVMPPLDFLNILSKSKVKFNKSKSNKKSSLETNLEASTLLNKVLLINVMVKKVIFLLKIKRQTLLLL